MVDQQKKRIHRFGSLPCPCCGSEDAKHQVFLHDLNWFICGDCEREFSLEQVKKLISSWQKVIDSIELIQRMLNNELPKTRKEKKEAQKVVPL